MAQLIFSTIGRAVGSELPGAFGVIGGAVGRVAGAALGAAIDQRLFSTARRYEGPRLTDLHIQGSTEGASIPAVYGRVRIAGQVIWAARFKEHSETHSVGGGKGGGPRATGKDYTYSLSFAVGLCEGEVVRIGRAWANGEPLDLSQVTWRLHTGAEDQVIDSIIEAVEGEDAAPAYRGLAYVVFEDLPLADFGNVIPQLSFEVVRPAPARTGEVRFEDRVKAVCLCPGSGEFVYATTPVFRDAGAGTQLPENVHAEKERANLVVALDQLAADFPNCEMVTLVVNWFGDDLRCGECTVAPRVETADKHTTPLTWMAGGLARDDARVVSQLGGAPAYGGTPDDASVLQAIAELKARGYKVGLYPMMLMDVAGGNELPDPYGGAEQLAYPWRGRVGLHPASGHAGSPDKTASATAQIAAFVGAASASDFGVHGGLPTYSGPANWSYRRFILHCAKLAQIADGVDRFIVGSELRALTTARDGAASYPFVAALLDLAREVRAMIGAPTSLTRKAEITYAADWSEYFGHQPQDGSSDVFFHLDPLWADDSIDAIGIDWYPPLTDWRDGATHVDATIARNIYDPSYLEGRIEAGEDFEWYYASDDDRAAQVRTAITDGAHAEPWVFRPKDLRNFWSRAHFDRPGGVRASAPTAWTPESKSIWFVELGCPAVDRGSNAPNLFIDAKSSESTLPPFSNGARDDLIQRRTLDAYLRRWADGGGENPISTVTGKPMVADMSVWCWDARPHPAFPARSDVWADSASWRLGHWLTGRAGLSGLDDVVAHLCLRAGADDVDATALLGAVNGYVLDSPSSARTGLEPLAAAYDFVCVEQDGALRFTPRTFDLLTDINTDALTAASAAENFAQRADGAETPIEARVRFLDPARDYLLADVSARRLDRARGGVESVEAPLVLEVEAAEALAQAVLAGRRANNETLQIELGPAHLALEPGDAITLQGGADIFEITSIVDAEARRIELRRAAAPLSLQTSLADPNVHPPVIASAPAFSILDLPPLPGFETDERPLAAVFAAPWVGAHEIDAGPSLDLETQRAVASRPAIMGELVWALWPGPVDRWDNGNRFRIQLYAGSLSSAGANAVLNGANVFAIDAGDGEWEVLQATDCVLTGAGEYELSGLLRGRLGSAHAMNAPHPVGARIVVLDERLARFSVEAHEWGEPLLVIAPPSGALATDPRALQATPTLPHAAIRAWAPAQLRARRAASGDVTISWIRCARIGGDNWGAAEPPIGAAIEAYLLEIVDGGGAVVRSVSTAIQSHVYLATEQIADFGSLPGSLHIRVGQVGDGGVTGLKTELTITL